MQAPILVLRQGTPISEISGRDLPSPADIKGEYNVMLLPYYQEIEKKDHNESSLSDLNATKDDLSRNSVHGRSKSQMDAK